MMRSLKLFALFVAAAMILSSCTVLIGIPDSGIPDGYVSAVEYFDKESFQDYLDYCKYIYADSDAVPGRAGLSTVANQDIVTLAGYFDNFRSWMETCKRLDEYDFDPTCVDNADWFRIKTEPLVFDDFTDEYADYTIWFFDSQTSTLYYFHLNI